MLKPLRHLVRGALSDDLVLMYLGFAQASSNNELDASLVVLRKQRDEIAAKLAWLRGHAKPHDGAQVAMPAAPAEPGEMRTVPINMTREIARTTSVLEKLNRKVTARSKALPLYRAALETGGLIEHLRSQRDHPVHTLLRRIYHETRP